MKTMTCKQLGGACDKQFQASTFEDMAELSKQHGMEIFKQQDPAHLDAMKAMQELMKHPYDLNKWLESTRKIFDELLEN